MHSRFIERDGKRLRLDFGHEGVLFKQSFVMYDKQTQSKWNHSTGLAMKGPLVGKRLTPVPSRMMHWADWKNLHPETRVLLGPKAWGFMGHYQGNVRPSSLGLSVGIGPGARLYPYPTLERERVINDSVGFQDVVVVMEPTTHQSMVFSRVVGNKTLHFEPGKPNGQNSSGSSLPFMHDRETSSIWDPLRGEAVNGPLKGKKLESLVGVTWLRNRWRSIYPDGTVYQGS